MRDEALKFLKNRQLCTVATVDNLGNPEAAMVAYSEADDLRLCFGTPNQSRKYKNLQSNPKVAIVVADTLGEVQYEGLAKEIIDPEYRELIIKKHLEKNPGSKKYANDPSQTYFEIIPTWIRFITHGEPDIIEEMTEF